MKKNVKIGYVNIKVAFFSSPFGGVRGGCN
jgi:hypothetical protein